MKRLANVYWGLAMAGLLGMPWPSHGQDDPLKKAVSEIATREGKKLLAGRKWKIDQPRFTGTLEVVEPQRNFRATIHSFQFANDQARVKMALANGCRLEGKVKDKNTALDVTVQLHVQLAVDGTATLIKRPGGYFLKPSIDDLVITVAKVTVQPAELGVEEKNLVEALNVEFRNHKDAIRQYVNGVLQEQKVGLK